MISVRMVGSRIVSVRMTRRGGEGAADPPARARAKCESVWRPRTNFSFFGTIAKCSAPCALRAFTAETASAAIDMFRDLPIRARELKATPEMLERIYDAARLGLRGESLALAAGMLPAELARLKIMDPIAEVAEMKGRADSEMEMSRVVFDAAQAGDSKAALEFLKHRHSWVATQRVEVEGSQQISIKVALEEAEKRVATSLNRDIEDAKMIEPQNRWTGAGALTNQPGAEADGYAHSDTTAAARAAEI